MISPSRAAHFFPLVKIMPAPSRVDQIVDAPTAAETFSPGNEGLLEEKTVMSRWEYTCIQTPALSAKTSNIIINIMHLLCAVDLRKRTSISEIR